MIADRASWESPHDNLPGRQPGSGQYVENDYFTVWPDLVGPGLVRPGGVPGRVRSDQRRLDFRFEVRPKPIFFANAERCFA